MKRLIALMILAAGTQAQAQSLQKNILLHVTTEYSTCTRNANGETYCRSTGRKVSEDQVASLRPNPTGASESLQFRIGGDDIFAVNIAAVSSDYSGNRVFITAGLGAGNLKNRQSLFEAGNSVIELSAGDSLKSLQLYSPLFDLGNTLTMIKATVTFKQSN